jgi:serine/threonine-protein kinase HipA
MTPSGAEVWTSLDSTDVLVGRLYAHQRRGAESATFRYDDGWLADRRAYPIDPLLPLTAGSYQTATGRALFGAFSDCAPDRWGRRLITRQERHRTDEDGGAPRSFSEFDYLMGVRDDGRQGALRFRWPDDPTWQAGAAGFPHLVDLPQLLNAARRVEEDTDTAEDLTLLVRAGSSLGGARPKAHVVRSDGRLAIAKFPSTGDLATHNVPSWEHAALSMARTAGVTVPDSELVTVDGARGPVLIVDRFDRDGDQRTGYISAMTLLEAGDGDEHAYTEIAEALEPVSPTAERDLHELWRRMVFGILISNTDDHLRNHGFLRKAGGWQLSPAFDLNPSAPGVRNTFATIVDVGAGDQNAIDTALEVAASFRLETAVARAILAEVLEVTVHWRDYARASGVADDEIAELRHAFVHDQAAAAQAAAA